MNIMRNEGSIYLTENFKGIHFLLLFQFLYTSTCMAFSHKTSLSKRHITMHSDNVHHIELENQQKQKTKTNVC